MGDFCITSSMYERSDRSLLGFHLLVGFLRGFAIQGAMWEIFAQILWSMRNLILAFLCFFSLCRFRGFFYLGCHMGDLSTNSLEYEKSDLSLFEFLPLWGFIIQGAMWEIFAQIL